MFACVNEFLRFQKCESRLQDYHVTTHIMAPSERYWYGETVTYYLDGTSIASLVKLGRKTILVLEKTTDSIYAEIFKDILRGVESIMGVRIPITIEVIKPSEDDETAVIIRTPDETYISIFAPDPLPIYYTDKLIVMATVMRGYVLDDKEKEVVEEFKKLLSEATNLIYEARDMGIKIPAKIDNEISLALQLSHKYIYNTRVLALPETKTKEQALNEIKGALEVLKQIVKKLQTKITMKKLLS